MTAAERVRRLDAAVNDVRLALMNPAVCGERRVLLQGELLALRCARLGVKVRGQHSYLRRLGIVPSRRYTPGPAERAAVRSLQQLIESAASTPSSLVLDVANWDYSEEASRSEARQCGCSQAGAKRA
jgi:hypothetical protein